jgi:hypothetical protein
LREVECLVYERGISIVHLRCCFKMGERQTFNNSYKRIKKPNSIDTTRFF